MSLLRRRARLPAAVKARLDLPRGDRALAIAELTDGWAVASTQRLHVLPNDETATTARAWSDVDSARLDAETAQLTLTWVDGAPATVLRLADETSIVLPRAVHERVQSSVVHTEKVALPRGANVRVALRRDPEGNLLTQVLGTGDVDLTDPGTARLVDAAEARVREAAGLH